MHVAKIMTAHPMAVDMDTKVSQVKWIFDHHNFRHLLVTHHEQLVGVISTKDVFANLSPTVDTRLQTNKDSALLNKRAHQIMSHNPITLLENADVFDAITIFYKKKLSCLPIVDADNKPVGILTTHDVFALLYEQHKANKEKKAKTT
jgi:acetoin utilization protein AcuB